jgi:hypothetical protein
MSKIVIHQKSISLAADPIYWQALGQFIEAFSSAETSLFLLLTVIAKIPNDIAKAVLSGVRTENLISFIKRVWEIREPVASIRSELQDVFEQMTAINKVRNNLIHNVSFLDSERGRMVSNIARALTQDRLEETRADPAFLADLTHDLRKINVHCVYHIVMGTAPQSAKFFASEAQVLNASWHYKRQPERNNQLSKSARKDRKTK